MQAQEDVVPRAFVIRPFEKKKDSSGKEMDFERVHTELIAPALEATGYGGETTTGEIVSAGNILKDMMQGILEADLVICDITTHNANVFYELGIRHALRRKRTLLIRGKPTADGTPFDLLTDRYFAYDAEVPGSSAEGLVAAIQATKSNSVADSPVFQHLPTLPEPSPSAMSDPPESFREEVDRARAGNSKGLLRLLSQEVRELKRFERVGLALIGEAQWALWDHLGAADTWEAVRENHDSNDVAANRALASIYGELYRDSGKLELRQKSEQAVDRIVNGGLAGSRDRARALTVRADNLGVEWLSDVLGGNDQARRREQGITRTAFEAYTTYHSAFLLDPGYVHAGLGALLLGEILLDLSREGRWTDAFETDGIASVFKDKLARDVRVLRGFLPELIDVELARAEADSVACIRARFGRALVLFFTEQRHGRVVQAFKDAMSRHHSVAHWDLVKRNLQLCSALGVQKELAELIIGTMEQRLAEQRRKRAPNLVLFAGVRATPSWRRGDDEQVAAAIRRVMERFKEQDLQIDALAAASPGTDIIFHEVCLELEIPSTICLPLPEDEYGGAMFTGLDDWKRRYRNLIDRKARPVVTLNDRPGLPNWMYDADVDASRRGEEWLVHMALARDAEQVNLITYCEEGEGHVEVLARASGKIRITKLPEAEAFGSHNGGAATRESRSAKAVANKPMPARTKARPRKRRKP